MIAGWSPRSARAGENLRGAQVPPDFSHATKRRNKEFAADLPAFVPGWCALNDAGLSLRF
jgi:hypothetical protein